MHSKKGKGTTMNKLYLYNTPHFKGILDGSANIIYDSAAPPKYKREMKSE